MTHTKSIMKNKTIIGNADNTQMNGAPGPGGNPSWPRGAQISDEKYRYSQTAIAFKVSQVVALRIFCTLQFNNWTANHMGR